MENLLLAIKNSEDWFLSKLYESKQPEQDVLRILKTLQKYVHTYREIFYAIEFLADKPIRVKPLNDLADDCFICVSLFPEHIEMLHVRRAAPTVGWYEDLGSSAFARLGYYGICEKFFFWEKFIRYNVFKGFGEKYIIEQTAADEDQNT